MITVNPPSRKSGAEHVAQAELGSQDDAAMATITVKRALDRLPSELRLVVALRYLDGYPRMDIAEALQLPETTVRARLQHALEQLFQDVELVRAWRVLGHSA